MTKENTPAHDLRSALVDKITEADRALHVWLTGEYLDDQDAETIGKVITHRVASHPPAAEPVGLGEAMPIHGLLWSLREHVVMTLECQAEQHVIEDAVKIVRQAADVIEALATPARTDDAAQAGGDAADVREFADKVMDAAHDCCIDPDAGPDATTSVSFTGEEGSNVAQAMHRLAARALPSQEVEPAATCNDRLQVGAGVKDGLTTDGITQRDREDCAELFLMIGRCTEKDAQAIRAGEWDATKDLMWFAHRRATLATQAAYPTGAGEGRWAGVIELVEQITAEEGASVMFVCPNPDFNGLPNESVQVLRGPGWEEQWFRADTLADCLRAALAASDAP